jgi:hypothetical protein
VKTPLGSLIGAPIKSLKSKIKIKNIITKIKVNFILKEKDIIAV